MACLPCQQSNGSTISYRYEWASEDGSTVEFNSLEDETGPGGEVIQGARSYQRERRHGVIRQLRIRSIRE